jgi:hypothetical protein
MRTATYVLLILTLAALSLTAFAYLSHPSQAQARGADVQMISFPTRSGVIYRNDQEYDAERRLERYFSRGYELEAVIEDTDPKAPPILVFRR